MKNLSLVAIIAAITSSAAHAATSDSTMIVSATISRTCEVTAEPLAFNTIGETGAAAQSAVEIICTSGSTTDAPTVTFSAGGQATLDQRHMVGVASGAATVPYMLAETPGGENLTSGTGIATTTADGGISYSTTVYGSIPAGAYQIGIYSDTVTVTVTYATP